MPTYDKNFSWKFLYLQKDIVVGFLDFENPKIQKKSENTRKMQKYKKNPKFRNPPFPRCVYYYRNTA